MLYVVSVLHQTGHGPVNTPVMVTHNFSLALKTALEVEDLGYEFTDETGVSIHRLNPETPHPKNLFKLSGDEMPPVVFPLVFGRMKMGSEWRDTWFNEAYEARYSQVPAV